MTIAERYKAVEAGLVAHYESKVGKEFREHGYEVTLSIFRGTVEHLSTIKLKDGLTPADTLSALLSRFKDCRKFPPYLIKEIVDLAHVAWQAENPAPDDECCPHCGCVLGKKKKKSGTGKGKRGDSWS